MLNEAVFLQVLTLSTLNLYIKLINILSLWYAAGLYLIFLGFLLLAEDGDIFVGFLWVVDFGVGLIFFIFVLHFSNFLYQKAQLNVFARSLVHYWNFALTLIIFFYFASPSPSTTPYKNYNHWSYLISWYNFYGLGALYGASLLQLLRELYFFNNSFEFFLANFMLLYGIVLAVLICFMLKKMFTVSTLHQFKHLKMAQTCTASYIIRQQNFIRQQNTSAGTRVWKKQAAIKSDI